MATVLVSPSLTSMLVVENETSGLSSPTLRTVTTRSAPAATSPRPSGSPVSDFVTKLNVTISSLKPDMSPQAIDANRIRAVDSGIGRGQSPPTYRPYPSLW